MKEMINKVIQGDCLTMMKQIPDGAVDLILTDPPYMISSEIVISRTANSKYQGPNIVGNFGEWDKQWKSKNEYITWCSQWLSECVRVLKPYCHLVFFFDRSKISYIWDYLESQGMKMRSPLYWLKTNPVPRARKIDFMSAIETMLWATKTAVKQGYFNWQLGQHANYFRHCITGHTTKSDGAREHPTQKPVGLMSWLIRYLSKEDNLVLDPFVGSGTTCVASKNTDRRFIGIDIDEKYCNIARNRLNQISENIFTIEKNKSNNITNEMFQK